MMTICVGEVVAVEGAKITIRIFEESNKDTIYYQGKLYKGISIREYISIQRGFRDIVCLVQGEYLDERRYVEDQSKRYFERKVEVKPIGHIEHGKFFEGIKYLPMIKDEAYLVKEELVAAIYTRTGETGLIIGKLLKEEIPIGLPWKRLFNTHIGIFGNTGSGKSNTLAKLYTTLFDEMGHAFINKSQFVILDFNGEYTNNQILTGGQKKVIRLNTSAQTSDKFSLGSKEFWNTETLSILFQATTNTQRPFISRLIGNREKFISNPNSLLDYIASTFQQAFSAVSAKPESLDLLRRVSSILKNVTLDSILQKITWVGGSANAFKFGSGSDFFNSDGNRYSSVLKNTVEAIDCSNINAFDEFIIRAHLRLTVDLLGGFVQFDHIQPLLKRAEAALVHLRKVLEIADAMHDTKVLTVISMRNCNQEVKKVLPLLIAKHFYSQHRSTVASPPDKTMHLIIDEAHNILSEQSSREHEVWRDYRLELFEEIIKEGRKFGMFITLSSQRPADISPTIVSQLHNFFIHRLVNDRDLQLIDNTISTLDSISKGLIPGLSKGCCVVTGTSFDLPMTIQIDALESNRQPDSEDVDLQQLWKNSGT